MHPHAPRRVIARYAFYGIEEEIAVTGFLPPKRLSLLKPLFWACVASAAGIVLVLVAVTA